jgi:hypothetical protein
MRSTVTEMTDLVTLLSLDAARPAVVIVIIRGHCPLFLGIICRDFDRFT